MTLRYEKYKIKRSVDTTGHYYVPVDMQDAIEELDRMLSEAYKNDIARTASIAHHRDLGMWIRNNWGLWHGGAKVRVSSIKRLRRAKYRLEARSGYGKELIRFFQIRGVTHPDAMSGILLEGFRKHLLGENVDEIPMLSGDRLQAVLDENMLPEYWEHFYQLLIRREIVKRVGGKLSHWWISIPQRIDGLRISLAAVVIRSEHAICAEVHIPDNGLESHELNDYLIAQQSAIQCDIGKEIEWRRDKNSGSLRIRVQTAGDISDKSDWDRQHDWFAFSFEQLSGLVRNRFYELVNHKV